MYTFLNRTPFLFAGEVHCSCVTEETERSLGTKVSDYN